VEAPKLDFDPAGNPVLLYVIDGAGRLATRDGSGWLFEPVGAAFGPNTDYGYDLGFDPASSEATIAATVPAGSKKALKLYRRTGATADPWVAETVATGDIYGGGTLRFNPADARATIAYMLMKGASGVLRVAERVGTQWTSQDAAAADRNFLALSFDGAGNPAVAFASNHDWSALRFALRQGSSWPQETVDSGPGAPFTSLVRTALAFDPVRGDFAAAAVFGEPGSWHQQLRYCERAAGAWACTNMAETHNGFGGLSFAFSADGTAHLIYRIQDVTMFDAVRPPGGAWTHEPIDWNVRYKNADLAIGPDGQPAIAYCGLFNPVTTLSPPDPLRFARRSPWP
jgi:hypothetical protein